MGPLRAPLPRLRRRRPGARGAPGPPPRPASFESAEGRLRARFAAAAVPPNAGTSSTRSSPTSRPPRPSLASYVHREADREQVLDLLRLRSVYHLKETDPTAWAVPRLPRASQAALVELHVRRVRRRPRPPGPLGSCSPAPWRRAGSTTGTARTSTRHPPRCRAEQRDDAVRSAPAAAGGRRRPPRCLRGDQLDAFAPDDPGPPRLEMPTRWSAYYLEHVEADAVHEQSRPRHLRPARRGGPLVAADVFFGVFTCLDLEDRLAGAALASWGGGVTDQRDDPDVILCPGGPMLIRWRPRGRRRGRRGAPPTPGLGGVPVRAHRDLAVVRRHAQGGPAAGLSRFTPVDDINESLDIRKVNDLVEVAVDFFLRHAENGATKINILPAGEFGMKARSNL